MRGLWVMVAVVALAGLGWLAFSAGSDDQAPPTLPTEEERPAPWNPADSLPPGRNPVPPRNPDAPIRPDDQVPPTQTETPTAPESLSPDMGRIRLKIYDSVTNLPVPSFGVVFTIPSGRLRVTKLEPGEATLDVPLNQVGELLIEAEGYTPETRQGFSVSSQTPEVPLRIYLNPRAAFSGIEILAVDDRGLPVTHLQVTARRPDYPQSPPLWVRRAAQERGVYQLPDLEPAAYRLHLAAIDEDGQRLPLLDHEETVTFYGSERVALSIQFLTGSLLTVTVTHVATGELRGTEVNLAVGFPDGSIHSQQWRSQVEGELLERRDGLPAAAPATLAEPVPPGEYQLTLKLSDGVEQTVPVRLFPGEHQQLQLRL